MRIKAVILTGTQAEYEKFVRLFDISKPEFPRLCIDSMDELRGLRVEVIRYGAFYDQPDEVIALAKDLG